ncbi:MAG: glycosyltransferase family 4 protein [Candidatus Tectimicrobiota bacterium]
MTIAYDARYITAKPTGIGQLCLELLRGFAQCTDGPRLHVLVTCATCLPTDITAASHLHWVPVPWAPRGPRDQLYLGQLLRQRGITLLHSIDAFQPLCVPGLQRIVTVHDLIHFTCTSLLHKSQKARFLPVWRTWLRLQCARACAVVTVSQHSAADLTRLLRVPPHKLHVIYNPVRQWLSPGDPGAFRQRFGLHEARVIAYVGRHDPYKNLVNLIYAVARLQQTYHDKLRLVIAGPADRRYTEAQATVHQLGLTEIVVFSGYLDDASLGTLYHLSDVFVFPSLYEGFGLPPLEAMACGTPVVASNRTALPEVLGEAALLVEPAQPHALAEAIRRVLTEPGLAQQLRQAGYERVACFSARRAAEQHLTLYQHLLEHGRHV